MDDETVTLEDAVTPETPLLGEDHLQEQRDDDERRPSTSSSSSSSSRPIRRLWKLILSPLRDDTAAGSSSHGWSVVVGLTTLTIVGTSLGLLLPQNQNLPTPWYRAVSAAIGYTYFSCWSVSFYPQVLANYTRKSTHGLSTDFCALNVLGFFCYAISNACFFYSKSIQDMYKKRHGSGSQITVQSNDVAFAVHAFCLSLITLMQIAYYNSNGNNGGNGGSYIRAIVPSRVIGWIMIGIVVTILVYASIVAVFHKSTWLDFLYLLSYIKIFVSLIKYIPQVILNTRRKSTVGWSIWNILLDFTGGLLSVLQLVFDCADLGDWTGITGNSAKFGLGFVSIFFDLFFMLQHYVLYPDADQQQQQHPGAENITTTVPSEQEENTDNNNCDDNNNEPNETV